MRLPIDRPGMTVMRAAPGEPWVTGGAPATHALVRERIDGTM